MLNRQLENHWEMNPSGNWVPITLDLMSAARRTNTEALQATAECLRAGSLAEEVFGRHHLQSPRTQLPSGAELWGRRLHAEAAAAAACIILA